MPVLNVTVTIGTGILYIVREGGVEPPSLSAQAPHACVSAIPPPAQKLIYCYSRDN